MTWSQLATLLASPNARWVLAGSLLLGAGAGLLGTFALLRKRGLMGDVLAHAALPGVAAGFWIAGTKSVVPLLAGAVVSGFLGAAAVDGITRHSRIKEETSQALVLSVFYGIGVVFLTALARTGAAGQSGLNRFLIGQAASLVRDDVLIIGGAALLVTLAVVLCFKELKLLAFDPAFGAGLGLPMRAIDGLLMTLVVVTVAIGLQAVGVVLVAALLITPAAAARYWTERLERMAVLAGTFGGVAGVAGTFISLTRPQLATGPLVVLVATGVLLFSLAFGAQRGLVVRRLREARTRRLRTHECAARSGGGPNDELP